MPIPSKTIPKFTRIRNDDIQWFSYFICSWWRESLGNKSRGDGVGKELRLRLIFLAKIGSSFNLEIWNQKICQTSWKAIPKFTVVQKISIKNSLSDVEEEEAFPETDAERSTGCDKVDDSYKFLPKRCLDLFLMSRCRSLVEAVNKLTYDPKDVSFLTRKSHLQLRRCDERVFAGQCCFRWPTNHLHLR